MAEVHIRVPDCDDDCEGKRGKRGHRGHQEQGQISIADTSTKAQIKTATNAVMIASAAEKGFTLQASRIFTVADIAG